MAFHKAALYDATGAALAQVLDSDGSFTPLKEAETRRYVVDPVLTALGYRTLDHIRLEYRLEASGQFVDYLLKAGEQDVVVDAEPLGAELSPKDASQIVGYCATEGIRWALLTNGLRWQVFDIEVSGNWEAKRVSDINLEAAYRNDTLAEALDPLSYFARETLLLDDSDLRAWAHEERARRHLDELVSNPASPVISAVVAEMTRVVIDTEPDDIVALLRQGTSPPVQDGPPRPPQPVSPPAGASEGAASHYIFPVADEGGFSPREHLEAWLGAGFWGVRQSTAHRTRITAGDECCFYAKTVGVVARAHITGPATERVTRDEWPGSDAHSEDVFKVPLSDIQWLAAPAVIDSDLRPRLDAFRDKDLSRPWGWFIQSTGRVTEHDFQLLVGA